MAEYKKAFSKVEEVETNLRVLKLEQHITKLPGWGAVQSNKNIVAFLGPTQSGKSTFINCLAGNELISVRDDATGDTFLIKTSELFGPKIGHPESGKSETEEPQFFENLPGTYYPMCDFAGFGDNKGIGQELKNGVSYQTILCLQNTVRFVLVATCDLIKAQDPLPFYKLLHGLHKISPQIADSLCIVSSRGGSGSSVEKLLERALKKSHNFHDVDKNVIDIVNQSRKIIEKVLKNGNYFDFKASENEGLFALPNKQLFIDRIKKMPGITVSDIPLMITPEAQNEISDLYHFCYGTVKREVATAIYSLERCIQRNIEDILNARDEFENPTTAASRLALFKRGKSNIDELNNSVNFEEFFDHAEEMGVVMSKSFTENMKTFVFIERLRNLYKKNKTDKSSKGEKEFFTSVKLALTGGAEKYNALIASSEAATVEERNVANENKNAYRLKVDTLQKEVNDLEKYNKSLLVRAAQKLSDAIDHVYDGVSEAYGVIVDLKKDVCVIS